MRIALGVPTLTRYDLLPKLIASAERGETRPEWYVIVDNGGGLETEAHWFPSGAEVVQPGWNLGVAASWNIIMERVPEATHVLLVGDDVELEARTLSALVVSAEAGAGFAIPEHQAGSAFSCFLLARWLYEKVGPFDEQFWPAYFEDNDYHHRMRRLGEDFTVSRGVGYEHVVSATMKSFSPEELDQHHARFRACREYYVRKWGGEPGHERYERPFDGQSG